VRFEGAVRGLLHIACAVPLGWVVYAATTNALGPDPVAQWMRFTGNWALKLLMVSLAMRLLARWFSSSVPIRFRRMFGLWAFAYACAHFGMWLVERRSDPVGVVGDLLARPFTTAGFLAFVLLVPLVVTSTKGMQRRLGRRWVALHRLVYVVAVVAVAHFWWGVKSGERIARLEPVVFAGLVAVLLGARLWWAVRRRLSSRP
jgi:methionine sulfoxide reductase heme-binding subunit